MRYLHSIFTFLALARCSLANPTAADFYVNSLPSMDGSAFDTLRMYAGHINIFNDSAANLFFALVESQTKHPVEKLVIWLNGGPGWYSFYLKHNESSSMDGLFLENGPFTVNQNGSITLNKYAWSQNANMLYIDQPIGTGFSTTHVDRRVSTYEQLVAGIIEMMHKFFAVFPHFRKAEVYLSGESFAGTYIPYIARGMVKNNEVHEEKINIKGMLIGNGWIDPVRQYESTLNFGKKHGLLTDKYLERAQVLWKACSIEIGKKGESIKTRVCEDILNMITEESMTKSIKGEKYCINVYDMRYYDKGPNDSCGLLAWPPNLIIAGNYLKQKAVVDAFHASLQTRPWIECDEMSGRHLASDESGVPSYKLLPELLKIMSLGLFMGDSDIICNYMGIEAMVDNLEWNGKKGFDDNKKLDWYSGDYLAGYYRISRGISSVVIYNASHMVPIDQPKAALDIFNRFIGFTPTDSYILPEGAKPSASTPQNLSADKTQLPVIKDPKTLTAPKETPRTVGYIILALLIAGIIFYGLLRFWRKGRSNVEFMALNELGDLENGNDARVGFKADRNH